MTQTTETSVMFALAELQQSEVARQREEAAREAHRQKEKVEVERIERERRHEAELQAQRVAEVAARLRVDVEAREAAAGARVAAMQQALIQLTAERNVLHEHLQTSQHGTAAAPPPAVVRWALGGMALSLIAVAGMAIVMLTPPARTRTPEWTARVVPPAAPRPTQSAAAPLAPALAASPPVTSKPPAAVPHPKPSHHQSPTPVVAQPNPTACGDDPLCGLKFH